MDFVPALSRRVMSALFGAMVVLTTTLVACSTPDGNGITGVAQSSASSNHAVIAGGPSASCTVINAVAGSPIPPTTVTATGGTLPYFFSATGLPAGVSINSGTGVVSGTSAATGTFHYTVTVLDDDFNPGTKVCDLVVVSPPSGTCVTISAVMGTPITPIAVTGSGGSGAPYTFSATGLPAGLTMATDGTISGTPTVSGPFTYTVTVKDKDGHTGTFNCTVTVDLPPLLINCVSVTATAGNAIVPATVTAAGGAGAPYTFTAVGLPAGLTMSTGGTISGTPTVSGTFNYSVTVTDKDGNSNTSTCSVSVSAAPSVVCATITAVAGSAITPTALTASGGSGSGYTFAATGLPAGLTMSTTGVISGTPTESGTFSYTVTITDGAGNTGSTTCSITVAPAPSAACATVTAVYGVAITPVTLTGTGGTGGDYTFTATGLPAGLTMSLSGTISGTPTVYGTFSYTVTVMDKDGHIGTIDCSVTVSLPPVLANCVTITAVKTIPITPVTMTATGGAGGPYTFSATGLPAGLTMSSTGVISGTPTVTGTFNYTVTVTDKDNHSSDVNCSVTVAPPPPIVANCVSITAVKGFAITPVTMTATGGTGAGYTFSASGLPTGLTMSSTGVISGTPTVTGTFSYTVTVTDGGGNTGSFNCSVTVAPPPPIVANCVSITAVKNFAISPVTMTATGGIGSGYTFSAAGLPAGLTMSTGGTISGTPTVSGTFSYTVTITDGDGNTGSVNCSVTVSPPPAIVANCVSITATKGVAITPVTMTASGGIGSGYTFSATGLPAGLTMSTSGTISGTPTVSGTFNYTVTITDGAGNTGTVNCSVTVAAPPIVANCVSITAVKGTAITPVYMTASGGSGSGYTFSATGLPAGITMASNGKISGTPTVSGTFSYTVTVTDGAGNTGTFNCSVTVAAPPPPPICSNCVTINATKGVAITAVYMTASGGSGSGFTFSATGLPAGLTMASNGKISGTPTVSGTFHYTVTVKDGAGNTEDFDCTVTVKTPPVVANCVAINAVKGVAITPVQLTASGGSGTGYTFTATGLPAGLTISSSGVISGTPTVTGSFNYTVTVKDSDGKTDTSDCCIVVSAPPSVTASCVSISAVKGTAITPVTMTGSGGAGGPYTFTVTGLPAGLTMSSSGRISGTPTATGTFSYTVTVKDKNGNTGTVRCSVTVYGPPTANCVSIDATKNITITPVQLTASGGSGGPYTFSATGLPAGLTMSSSGVISGKPTVSGTFYYTVTITDDDGNKGTISCCLVVDAPDSTKPECDVYEDANPPYMTYQDNGSGIVRLDVITNLNTNYNITITPTPSGTTFSPSIGSQPSPLPTGTVVRFPTGVTSLIKVTGVRISKSKSAQLTVKATDAAGNTVTCDPVETTVTKLKQDDGNQTFENLPYDESIVTIENGGLREMDLDVNGTIFKVKRLKDDEIRVVDVKSAMRRGNKNTITLIPKGKRGETADVTIGPPDDN